MIPFPSGTVVVNKVNGSNSFIEAALDFLSISGVLPYTKGGTGLSTIGSANQILGVNNSGDGFEYKTESVGTSGSDFNISQSVSGITYNLPNASATARGAITTGTQTLLGSKTFLSDTTFSGNAFGRFFGTPDATDLQLFTSGSTKWKILATSGYLVPSGNNSLWIGTQSLNVQDVFTYQVGTGDATELILHTNNSTRWTIAPTTGDFLPNANNNRVIGAPSLNLNAVNTYQVGTGDDSFDFTLYSNNINRWRIGKTDGHLRPNSDNIYDLGDPSHTIANAYIKNISGPAFADWSPNINSNGGGVSSFSVFNARYFKLGTMCGIALYLNWGIGDAGSNYLTFSLPFNSANTYQQYIPIATQNNNGTQETGFIFMSPNSSEARIYRSGAATWTITAGQTHYAFTNFLYETA